MHLFFQLVYFSSQKQHPFVSLVCVAMLLLQQGFVYYQINLSYCVSVRRRLRRRHKETHSNIVVFCLSCCHEPHNKLKPTLEPHKGPLKLRALMCN